MTINQMTNHPSFAATGERSARELRALARDLGLDGVEITELDAGYQITIGSDVSTCSTFEDAVEEIRLNARS